MTTHKTLDAARMAAKANAEIRFILEIDHATEGRCYIGVKVPMEALKIALYRKPMAEIKRLVAEHTTLTAEEIRIAREQYLRENTKCDRCGTQIDGNIAYSQQERFMNSTVTAWYCAACVGLLRNIGMGEFDGLQERASARGSREPYTKEDF
jgi:hypothetical protein